MVLWMPAHSDARRLALAPLHCIAKRGVAVPRRGIPVPWAAADAGRLPAPRVAVCGLPGGELDAVARAAARRRSSVLHAPARVSEVCGELVVGAPELRRRGARRRTWSVGEVFSAVVCAPAPVVFVGERALARVLPGKALDDAACETSRAVVRAPARVLLALDDATCETSRSTVVRIPEPARVLPRKVVPWCAPLPVSCSATRRRLALNCGSTSSARPSGSIAAKNGVASFDTCRYESNKENNHTWVARVGAACGSAVV